MGQTNHTLTFPADNSCHGEQCWGVSCVGSVTCLPGGQSLSSTCLPHKRPALNMQWSEGQLFRMAASARSCPRLLLSCKRTGICGILFRSLSLLWHAEEGSESLLAGARVGAGDRLEVWLETHSCGLRLQRLVTALVVLLCVRYLIHMLSFIHIHGVRETTRAMWIVDLMKDD